MAQSPRSGAAAAATSAAASATTVAAVVPTNGALTALRPLSATDVTLTGGFWADRATANRERTIPAGFEQLTNVGTLENFRLAARSFFPFFQCVTLY